MLLIFNLLQSGYYTTEPVASRYDAATMGMFVLIIVIGVSALFSIITLPVEYNASQRALAWLQSSHTLEGAQLGQAKEALSWAARTYLVAALSAVASLLYYVLMILGRRD